MGAGPRSAAWTTTSSGRSPTCWRPACPTPSWWRASTATRSGRAEPGSAGESAAGHVPALALARVRDAHPERRQLVTEPVGRGVVARGARTLSLFEQFGRARRQLRRDVDAA